ncbi:phosphatidylserine decarboxylase [Fluviispira sanaruensis]|uniref:phosphatidylserine decarboxylase n=1 Tax=Fluviispira sanaruensis TaxID=2493639 RepID=A0A4P2VXU8_FLUSA|nr:phosphatidylserine decarboxylase [Fluviispira sanaruensis]BBH54475.1 phosphatidylserine decarboxylase [Fluviispira sanaruensis]
MLKSILGSATKQIEVIKRKSGEKFIEKIYGEDAMKVFYGSPAGAAFTAKFLTNKWISNIYGAYNDSGASKHKIEEFVNNMGIDVSESEKDISEYHSFNDFFARKLHPRARPINRLSSSIISPGDGRLLVFPKISETTLSYVKWAPIQLIDLFQGNESLVERYKNGSCAILRLCPSDYHRFHFPVSGKAGITKTVPGLLHSVNPYALEQQIPVYCMNKRTLCELDSDQFGKVLLMEVGALFVGTIVQTYRPAVQVEKGDEKGYFKFGGSTCIFFFENGIMEFDTDIVKSSEQGLETLVQMGEKIGHLAERKV